MRKRWVLFAASAAFAGVIASHLLIRIFETRVEMEAALPDFFVWTIPSIIDVIVAANEQEAAETFLEQPATLTPNPGSTPACFVQLATGLQKPQADGDRTEFWVDYTWLPA